MDLDWYKTLAKPPFTPPSSVFSPAWIILYTLMFISVLVYINEESYNHKTVSKAQGCVFFIIQLALNLSWSPTFFMLHKIGLSFFIICLMLIFIFLTTVEFFKVSKLAGLLLLPYFGWVCFATYLNYGFMILN